MFNRRICTNSIPFKLAHRSNANVASGHRTLTSAKPSRKSLSPFRHPATSSGHYVHITFRRGVTSFALNSDSPQPPPDIEPETPLELSDGEWEIRTGRAIFVLQETIPEFFSTGLITSISKGSGTPRTPTSTPLTNLNLHIFEQYTLQDDDEPIYSPNIRLSYTPPLELPSPFPTTFRIDGIQLYVASSGVVRHTMNALYSDLTITLSKMVVNAYPSTSFSTSSGTGLKTSRTRDKSVVVRQTVTGIARVSRKPAEWEVQSTYTFSPITGLIQEHIIDSIHPAPHQAVYDSLSSTFGKLLRWNQGPRPNLPNGAAFKEHTATNSGKSE